jgi:hypothetical protein
MIALRAARHSTWSLSRFRTIATKKVLGEAKAEINQLAHFRVDCIEVRQRRTVTEMEFRVDPNDAPAQIATVDEMGRQSASRKARSDEKVQTVHVASVEQPALTSPNGPAKDSGREPDITPPNGTIRFGASEPAKIGRSPGGGWNIDLIADAYRSQMGAALLS